VPSLILSRWSKRVRQQRRPPGRQDDRRRARRRESELVLDVEDDGPGASPQELAANGVGLRSARERLRLLYGERQAFAAENLASGGFRVRMTLPYRPVEGAG
jgi:two-component system sensor histidine kinase AlgZ